MNNFSGQYLQGGWSVSPRWLFPKSSKVYISMSSDHRDGSAIWFFFHLNNQTLLHYWLYWNMRGTYSFFLEYIDSDIKFDKNKYNQKLPHFYVMTKWYSALPCQNLVTLIHGYSQLISLEIVVGYWKLRSF